MGGAMSICDLLSVLYGKRMKVCPEDPSFEDRDWLICSKGHAGPAVYVALALKGFFPKEWLYTLNQPGTRLPSHCDARKTPGIMAAYNGGTHMPFEDVAVLRAFPGMIIVEPTDHVMLKDLVKQLAKKKGIYYIRCARKNVTKIYEEGSEFEIGKGNIVKDGTDASVIASGIMVAEALKAAQILEEEGISVRVVDMFTIKPLDCGLTVRCAQETKAVMTAENHNIHGGLYGAVCEVLAKTSPVPVEAVGIKDEFGEVGDMEYLKKRFGLTADDIAQKVRKAIERKQVER